MNIKPNFDRLRELFYQVIQVENEIRSIFEESGESSSPTPTDIQAYDKKKYILSPAPSFQDYSGDSVRIKIGEANTGEPQVCACGGVKRHKKTCKHRPEKRVSAPPPPEEEPTEELAPFKNYRCLDCAATVQSRQHYIDLTCAKCHGTHMVQTANPNL